MAQERSATRTLLAQILVERIRQHGPISFAEYMRECLYHPELGYYSRATASRLADFYTNADVHPVFGRLLARQLAEMWALVDQPQPFWVVEAGAGTGRLARHVLDFAACELREFYTALQYVAVESSPARRAAQAASLGPHAQGGRAVSAAELPEQVPVGCVFSNELLDALPVHRVTREQGKLCEIYVGLGGDEFCERAGPLSTAALGEYFAVQDVELQEGQQVEAGLAACDWIAEAGRRLGRGFVLTVDYGHEAAELYDERHLRGTLLAYQRHRAGEDFFRAPGEQDLTAHVNFTALDLWGRRSGLERTGRASQGEFLLALGRANEFADLYEDGQDEADRIRARLLLKNLIYPEGMGEIFQVFVQHKGMLRPRLKGLEPL
jgi:SAM-dependent MidA family methyltransferase